MNYFSHYPYQNFSDYNLDWLMKLVKEVNEKLSEYLENSVITFADPITWDITEQYTALTCVVDSDGTAYLSKRPVPAGVDVSNTNYWLPIFNYDDNINALRATIAANERNNTTATAARAAGDLVYLQGKIYKIIVPMNAGDAYIIGTNCIEYTVAERIKDVVTMVVNNTNSISDLNDDVAALSGTVEEIEQEVAGVDGKIAAQIDKIADGTTNISILNYQSPAFLTHYFNKITMKDSTNSEYDVLVKGNLFNHLNNDVVIPQMYGAVGDGVADDTAAVRAFFNACLQGAVGYVPQGTYKCTEPVIIDYSGANVRQLKITGVGCYRSTFKSTITAGIAFLFTSGVLFDSFHTVISDVGFSADFQGTTLQLGKNDKTDCIGNANFSNVFITNSNSAKSVTAVAARYNYIFDCLFNNVVYTCGANGTGTSLVLELARFCTFVGGSYSNADKAIHFPATNYCDTLTFIGSDFENLNYGVYLEGNAQYIKFITCYFDIYRPDLTPATNGVNAIYSDTNPAAVGGIQFDNCLFARGGIYGSGGLNLDHINNVRINGIYSYPDPQPPASGATYKNSSAQDLFVYVSTLNSDEDSTILWYNILNYMFPDNTVNVQCGFGGSKTVTFFVPAGASIQIGYTGTIYWKLRPVNF